MLIETIIVGQLQTNCYLLADRQTKETAIIDPGAEGEKILAQLSKLDLHPKIIINTHGHYDHIAADLTISRLTGLPIHIHERESQLISDSEANLSMLFGKSLSNLPLVTLSDGEIISLGKLEIKILLTPGHTPGSISLTVKENVFCGDLIFAGSIGRTDLPGGSQSQLMQSIKEKILCLPDNYALYPGHGPATTVGQERKTNPHLLSG